MLATEDRINLHLTKDNELFFELGLYSKDNRNFGSNQHLYITSSDEIKEGDWFIANQAPRYCIRKDSGNYPFVTMQEGEEVKHFHTWRTKIIATTDPELHKDGIDKIGLPFIEKYITEYNKGMMIKEVNVEYPHLHTGEIIDESYPKEFVESLNKPKLRSDGTIIIHKIQEVFTKEDMNNSFIAGIKYARDFIKDYATQEFETWFEQNY